MREHWTTGGWSRRRVDGREAEGEYLESMKIEPTNPLKALKEKPSREAAKDVSVEEKVEAANELHEWLNDRGAVDGVRA